MSLLLYYIEICSCDIDFFIFRHHFRIMSPKFLNSERVSKLLEINIKLCNQNHEITKVNKIGQDYCLILFNTEKIYIQVTDM
jgi:hypothetical protein